MSWAEHYLELCDGDASLISFAHKPIEGSKIIIPTGKHIIGRKPECDLQLNIGHVSSQHATLLFNDTGLWISDLGSANGTYVNESPISEPVKLAANDKIDIQPFCFIVGLTVAENNNPVKVRPVPAVPPVKPADNRSKDSAITKIRQAPKIQPEIIKLTQPEISSWGMVGITPTKWTIKAIEVNVKEGLRYQISLLGLKEPIPLSQIYGTRETALYDANKGFPLISPLSKHPKANIIIPVMEKFKSSGLVIAMKIS